MTVEGAMSFLRAEMANLGIEDWRVSDTPDADDVWSYGRVLELVAKYNGVEITASFAYTVPVPGMGRFVVDDLKREIECLSSPTTTA